MTVLHNIVLAGPVEAVNNRFSSSYQSNSTVYWPTEGMQKFNNLSACWSAYVNKSVKAVHTISTESSTVGIAIGEDGLVATKTISSSGVEGTWTDSTSSLVSAIGLNGSNRHKILKTLQIGAPGYYVVVVCEKGKAAFTSTTGMGTTWYPINLNPPVSYILQVDWTNTGIPTILLQLSVGLQPTPAHQFFNEVVSGRKRGDLNNTGAITSADALLALRYGTGIIEIDNWARTNIVDYLVTNYSTLDPSLKALVNYSLITNQWDSTNTLSTDANNVVDVFEDNFGTVNILGKSGQIARVRLELTSCYVYVDQSLKDKITTIGGNNLQTTFTDNTIFSGTIVTDQGAPRLARMKLDDGFTTDSFSVGGNPYLTKVAGPEVGAFSTGGSYPVVLSIIDSQNFIFYQDAGTITAGPIKFNNLNGNSSKNYTVIYTGIDYYYSTKATWNKIENIKIFGDKFETFSDSLSYSSSGISGVPAKAMNVKSGSSTRINGLMFYTNNPQYGNFITTSDFENFHKSTISNNNYITEPKLSTYIIARDEFNDLEAYIITYHGDNSLNIIDISNNNTNLNYNLLDLSLPFSDLISIAEVTSLSYVYHLSDDIIWLVFGLNTGELIQCKVTDESSYIFGVGRGQFGFSI